MSIRFTEYTQRISYADIINKQLDRISEIRTHIHKYMIERMKEPYYILAREYMSAVETLMVILLPELRGNADRYIQLAKEFFWRSKQLDELEMVYDDHHCENYPNYEECVKIQKEIDKVNSIRKKLIQKLPEKYQKLIHVPDYRSLHVFYFLDAALEEMLTKLNQAGLLIQSKPITVGVPNVLSRSNKESI